MINEGVIMLHRVLFLGLISFSISSWGQVEKKLFTMEKNHNPENIMMIHTQTDMDCKFIESKKNNEKNFLEFYWIMDSGRSQKEVHPLIRDEIKKRVRFDGINERKDAFKVTLGDLKELRHDLTDTSMEVMSELSDGKCIVKSVLTLGASGNYKKLDIERTYCEVSKNLLGIPNGCLSLILEGKDVSNGETIKMTFRKK
jgi:hypothetical protein